MTREGSEDGTHLFGVEAGSFKSFQRVKPSFTFLCGVEAVRKKISNVRLRRIQVDGFDATEKLLSMIEEMKLDAVILGGITFAGFNMVDPIIILNSTGIPIIVYSGTHPDNEKMLGALKKHFNDWRVRWDIVHSLGPIHCTKPHPSEPSIYFEVVGGSYRWAEKILHYSAEVCRIPEPVRVAGIIARGLSPVF